MFQFHILSTGRQGQNVI